MLKKIYNQLNFGQSKKSFSGLQKFLVFSIIASSIIVILETEDSIYNYHPIFFNNIKYLFGFIFTVEYLLRIITCGFYKKHSGFSGRISYMLSFWALIDLLALIPFYISGVNETFLLRLFRLIRLFSVIRVGRYSDALKNVLDAIADRKSELLFSLAIASTVLLISSTFMYLLEDWYCSFEKTIPNNLGSMLGVEWECFSQRQRFLYKLYCRGNFRGRL
jgi:voltage-gated potassium channel